MLAVCYSFSGKTLDDARSALAALVDAFCTDRRPLEDEYNGEADVFIVCVVLAMVERKEWGRVPLYAEDVVPTCVEFEFGRLFRLLRHSVAALVAEFEHSAFYPEGLRGCPKMPAQKTVLIALSYIGTQCTMCMIADKFDVSESSVHVAVYDSSDS